MSNHDQHAKHGPSSERPRPFAVVGALVLVALAIAFGVFGPPISNRGNSVPGDLVSELFHGAVRDSVVALNDQRSQKVLDTVIADALQGRFGSQMALPSLESIGLEPQTLEVDAEIMPRALGASLAAIALHYRVIDQLDSFLAPDQRGVSIYFFERVDAEVMVSRNVFGTPVALSSGPLVVQEVDLANDLQRVAAVWVDGLAMYVVVAPDEITLDQVLELIRKQGKADETNDIQQLALHVHWADTVQ